MTKTRLKLSYSGSYFWLILWIIVFFPVALVLMMTSGEVQAGSERYSVEYEGSKFWLCFWIILCFPIAFALLLLNGVSMVSQQAPSAA